MAERDLFLGLDVGTTAIKGGLFDATGGLIVHARRGYPTSRPAPGIVEQNACDWTEGVVSIMDELLVADRAQRVAAVLLVHRQLQLAHDLAQALQGRFGLAPSAQDHEVVRVGYEASAEASLKPEHLPSQHEPAHVNVGQQW